MAMQSDEMRIFIAVVEAGSLSAAAEVLEQTTSGVSRALTRLEEKLGTSLLTRTTRRMDLTEEGQVFLEQAREIVAAMERAEESIRIRSQKPVGKLRVDASAPFMLHCIVPHVGAFREAYPDIELDLTTNDRFIDLVEQRTDIAIRIGELQDSTLHAKPLTSARLQLLASPEYLRRHGTPKTVKELDKHQLIGFTQPEGLNNWPLQHEDGDRYPIRPALRASSGETIRQLALHGQGIACLSNFMSDADVKEGRLVRLLEKSHTAFRQQIHAVYYRNTRISRRISCFLDFLQCKL
ncbi:LysR family transcriptional regulator [Herbaspirillum lusitanum]|uniref:LysR family transcriptional regulator n=1 Tax=Herbaspirillum lusitanum TaxID=213312 RepID=UPI0022387468|nr:LysR family transcriptional regulator [Herbaspirillum lusitanum]MCW5298463.1 LysR family transcriptional regulator [Herbaspirillum lusitanum]